MKIRLMPLNRNTKVLVAIILVGVLLRVIAAVVLGDSLLGMPGIFDQLSYHYLAVRVLEGRGFTFGVNWWPLTAANEPTAHWSYLYTIYLTGVYKLLGINPLAARLVQVILVGVLQPYLAYRIGRHVFNDVVGLLAAFLTVIYAYFIYYSASLMTEPFYITAILAILYLTILLAESDGSKDRRLSIILGLAIGIVVLLRQVFLLFTPLLLLWIWWCRRKRGSELRASTIAIVGVIVAAMILPVTAYNYSRFERFVLINTNSGYAVFWANHPVYGTHFEPILPRSLARYQDLIPEELRDLDEAALERELLRLGIQFVVDDPIRYMRLTLSRIPAYFMFWPTADSNTISNIARVASFGLLLPFMIYGLSRTFARHRQPSLILHPSFPLILFAVFYSVIHLLSWALIRYRLPVDAVMLIFASLGIVDMVSRVNLYAFKRWHFGISEQLSD